MKYTSFLMALTLGLFVAGTSMADPNCPLPGPGGEAPKMMGAGPHGDSRGSHQGECALGKLIGAATHNAGDLGLSEDKIKELDQLKAECQKVKILDEAKVKVACMELGNLMSPQSFDLKAAKAQIKKKMDLLAEMKVKEAELYQQALSLFTPEQLKKLDALVRVAHDPAMKGSMEHTCPMP